jgi:hypothetical protein
MTASDLNQLLEQDLAAYNLVVQATQQDECLSVVLNRPGEEHLDYSAIAKIITDKIKTLEIGEIHSLFLSSRVLGEYDLDWQTQFEFVSPSPIEQTLVQETEDKERKTPSSNNETTAESVITPEEVQKSPFANYCFISNKGLLTFQILPPDETLSKLIQFFHGLSDNVKADTLPLLEQFFATSALLPTEQFELEVQQWFEQLSQLNKAQLRKASIWFSRYCFNPEKTMTEVIAVIEPEPPIAEAVQEIANVEETPKISTTNVTQKRTTQTKTTTAKTQKTTSTVKLHPLTLPIGWLIFTLIIITFAIGSFDSDKLTAEACKNTTGKPEYCKLAVKLVGEVTFQQAAQQFTSPMTPSMKTRSLDACEIQGTIYAGKNFREAQEKRNPVMSSYGEEILPGVFIGDVKQTNFKQPGVVRTGCVLANTGKNVAILASDIIPTNWPEQPFEGKPISQESFRKTLGIFNILLALGAGTLFNAIGIYLASIWGLGIRVSSLETIYKAAFFLGILETMIGLLPIFGIFAKIALETLALGVIGLVVKDFHVQWSDGSKVVAAGTVTIIAVSYFLKILLFSMMAAMVH